MAVASYADKHGHYPPPFTVDADGNRLHSWRVLILPMLEERELYEKIKLDEPWNSPANQQLADQMPSIFAFHGEYSPGLTKTNYLAVVGDRTFWPPTGKRLPKDITDELASTIMVVENQGCEVYWMEPRDLDVDALPSNPLDPKGISSKYLHPAVVTADGHLLEFFKQFPSEVLHAMLTINGGEAVEEIDGTWSMLPDGRNRERKTRELNQ